MNDVDLRDLEAFAAVARHRSFRRAAAELRVSTSSLSQRVRDMEERLSVRLLNRTTRSVALTEAGERLMQRVGPALRDMAEALAQARDAAAAPAGRLRINAPAPAAQITLAPMIGPFLRRYPAIDLEIVVDAALVDIVAEGFDAGVRYEENLALDMVAVPLGPPQRYVVVAAPALLACVGAPVDPADLLTRPCIVTRFPSGATLPWEFEKDGRLVKLTPPARLAAMNAALQIRAAEDGAGFLLTFADYVREAVAAGRLATVLDDWSQSFPGPLLYYPGARRAPPALRAFIDFVADWRKAQPAAA